MEKISVKKGTNCDYELFLGDKKQINLDGLTEKCANMLKALAFINFMQDYNNRQSEFYKRSKTQVCEGITYLFNNNCNCESVFKFFGLNLNQNEKNMIVSLTTDICSCKDQEVNMHLAMKCFNINEKVKEIENEMTK